MKILIKKIRNKTLNIGVIGMGYVGLPLAILIAKKNYTVFGFDQDKKKINKLKKNISYINHISVKDISKVTKEKKLLPTCNFNLLSEMDIIIICVPTPLTKNKVPDLKHINNAVQKIIEKKKK
jgi:UDP-N-acetyl-D-glucosamine dehydrogenase